MVFTSGASHDLLQLPQDNLADICIVGPDWERAKTQAEVRRPVLFSDWETLSVRADPSSASTTFLKSP